MAAEDWNGPAPTSGDDVVVSFVNMRRIARCWGEYVGTWDEFVKGRRILAVIPDAVVRQHFQPKEQS